MCRRREPSAKREERRLTLGRSDHVPHCHTLLTQVQMSQTLFSSTSEQAEPGLGVVGGQPPALHCHWELAVEVKKLQEQPLHASPTCVQLCPSVTAVCG